MQGTRVQALVREDPACRGAAKPLGGGKSKGKGPEKRTCGASLVAQWLRIHLPMQGTRVRALVQEDPTCRGATKPMRHNY
ncbi:hypothetical protein J1605_021136 [Eschrichtius robustus]|uniref:Uncharacterized protein n=1 Tax=Eschrichtius robustus TaxID=9764 RepID=A0AB34HHM7_ESCRO|nr:hypothetical protein J1605_021136 [Eschrichtius robustus]